MMKSLYIHVPFCRKKCPYCDFYSCLGDQALMSAYLDAITTQARALTGNFKTIFIGGGTPSILPWELWKKLLESLTPFSQKASEFTIEANPESLTRELCELFLSGGVNRLSLGVQSLDDKKLRKLGRIHSVSQAVNKLALAKKTGFKNISADFIFGVPGESIKLWKKELAGIVELPLTHLSVYALTYEKNTPLYKKLQTKTIKPLSDRIAAEMFELNLDFLPKQGFLHYEVSNFALPGKACKHNLNYWDNGEYLGLGPAAVSFIAGVRMKNIPSLEGYLKFFLAGDSPVISSERLSPLRSARETAALKIRTGDGLDFEWFRRITGYDFLELEEENIEVLFRDRLLKFKENKKGIVLTRRGFLFSDSVSSQLI